MALETDRPRPARTGGPVLRDAQLRIDDRVTQIRARQEAALREMRRARRRREQSAPVSPGA
jgi:hypothetical protein